MQTIFGAAYRIAVVKPGGKMPLKDLGIDEIVILKLILTEQCSQDRSPSIETRQ